MSVLIGKCSLFYAVQCSQASNMFRLATPPAGACCLASNMFRLATHPAGACCLASKMLRPATPPAGACCQASNMFRLATPPAGACCIVIIISGRMYISSILVLHSFINVGDREVTNLQKHTFYISRSHIQFEKEFNSNILIPIIIIFFNNIISNFGENIHQYFPVCK